MLAVPGRPAAALLLVLALACSKEEGSRASSRRGGDGSSDSADGGIAIVTRTEYRPGPIAQSGTIVGTVHLEGAAPAGATHQVGSDSARCGASIVEHVVEQRNGALGEVVVWLDDIRTGKAPSELRRIELSHEHCQFTPRMLVTSAPSTLNVLNDDRAVHVTTVARLGASKPLLSIPFSDNGQVVPTELAARESGVVEVRCQQHPWARAYVASFDHPYFALTGPDGRFRLDSVPAGRYTLKLWHPRGARVLTQPVEVGAGGVVSVEPRLGLK